MKITRWGLRNLIREVLFLEQSEIEQTIQDFIAKDLLSPGEPLTRDDVIEQGEGAGFDSKDIEEALEVLLADDVIVDNDGDISLSDA